MRWKKSANTILLVSFLYLCVSCNLGPGEGGTATITGKVKVLEYNGSGILVNEYYAADEKVYLIYGEGTIQDDDQNTSYEGSYRFQFLRKGDYKIYVYSDCPSCDGQVTTVFTDVSITKNGEEVTADEITIEKH